MAILQNKLDLPFRSPKWGRVRAQSFETQSSLEAPAVQERQTTTAERNGPELLSKPERNDSNGASTGSTDLESAGASSSSTNG